MSLAQFCLPSLPKITSIPRKAQETKHLQTRGLYEPQTPPSHPPSLFLAYWVHPLSTRLDSPRKLQGTAQPPVKPNSGQQAHTHPFPFRENADRHLPSPQHNFVSHVSHVCHCALRQRRDVVFLLHSVGGCSPIKAGDSAGAMCKQLRV